jgi:hypothetical protein
MDLLECGIEDTNTFEHGDKQYHRVPALATASFEASRAGNVIDGERVRSYADADVMASWLSLRVATRVWSVRGYRALT